MNSNLSIDEKMQVEKPELDKENKFDDKTSILTTTDDDKRSSQSTNSSFLKRINSNPMLLNVANMNIPKLNAISNNMIRKSFSSKSGKKKRNTCKLISNLFNIYLAASNISFKRS